MKFCIITPTIFRSTLKMTMRSIDRQSHKDYEHLIIVDKPYSKEYDFFVKMHTNDKRKFIFLDQSYNDYGHTPRRLAASYVSDDVDYVMYIDDDDYYINDTMKKIDSEISEIGSKPAFFVFPCYRNRKIFFNDPPRKFATTSVQFAHLREYNGERIEFVSGDYGADGDFVEMMVNKYGYTMSKSRLPLVQVDRVSKGVFF